jgi:ATP-binding cassette subfamily B protein
MTFLFRFLFRNLKGYRALVFLAILVSFAGVAVDILAALPLKYIPAKLQSADHNPDPIWDNIVTFFDQQFDPAGLSKLTAQQAAPTPKPGTPTAKPGTPTVRQGTPTKSGTPTPAPAAQGSSTPSKPVPHTVLGVIAFSAVLLVVATLLDALLGYLQLLLAASIGQNLTARLRKQLFEQIQRLSLDWHGKQKKGDIVQRVTGNISDVEKFVTDGLVDLLTGILTIVGVAAVMFYYSVPYSLLSVVIIPALAVLVFSYTTSIKAASKKTAKAAGEVADVAVEDVGAITVIKAFDLVERETDRFNRYVDKTRKAGLRAGSLQAQFTPLVTTLVGVGTAIIIGIGAYVASGGTFRLGVTIAANSIDIGTVILFITLLTKLFQPMKDLSKLTNVATSATAGAERIQDILNQAPEVVETKAPYYGPQMLQGDIRFENVTFGYIPEKLILKGINLHIPAGRKVALVGLSGGGKTTLVKLIPRFYEVSGGSVKIDGKDVREYPLSLLRQNVSMVLQESVLFEGTILENLKIARPNATMDEVIKATKQAQIHDVIMSWPEGYGTLVRNQGKNFSGGQRQRLAIARALLSDAHILVLDEPTAALDVEAELEVMKALEELVVGRTVLMISHRLSTLGKVDEIIVLKDGQIVEQGTYKDLKKRPNGVFADLLSKQKQYDADYAGGSMIVPQAEIARMINQQRGPAFRDQRSVPANRQRNGSRRARVVAEVDGRITGEFELDETKRILRVGRMSVNDIPIPSERVSRLHARIIWENGGWSIEDLQSLNGLNYQGELKVHHRFANGDRVYLAPTVALIYQEEVPQAAPSRPPQPQPIGAAPPNALQPVVLAASAPQSAVPGTPQSQPQSLAPSVLRAQVVIEIDGKMLSTHPLDKDALTIGRRPGNDVQIASPLISGNHAMLINRDGQWLIIDRGSRNGLTYQGNRVESHRLAIGDAIYLAPNVALRFVQA